MAEADKPTTEDRMRRLLNAFAIPASATCPRCGTVVPSTVAHACDRAHATPA